jgi:hypothetical protein
MEPLFPYRIQADVVLIVHFAIVVFIVGGLPLIIAGNIRRWRWVNSFWFRLTHLAAIAVVVVQSWLGQYCGLTRLESLLRQEAGQSIYANSFIEHWVEGLLYYEAPFWVFVLAYTAFGLLVLFAWRYFPPRRNTRHSQAGAKLPH